MIKQQQQQQQQPQQQPQPFQSYSNLTFQASTCPCAAANHSGVHCSVSGKAIASTHVAQFRVELH